MREGVSRTHCNWNRIAGVREPAQPALSAPQAEEVSVPYEHSQGIFDGGGDAQ